MWFMFLEAGIARILDTELQDNLCRLNQEPILEQMSQEKVQETRRWSTDSTFTPQMEHKVDGRSPTKEVNFQCYLIHLFVYIIFMGGDAFLYRSSHNTYKVIICGISQP